MIKLTGSTRKSGHLLLRARRDLLEGRECCYKIAQNLSPYLNE